MRNLVLLSVTLSTLLVADVCMAAPSWSVRPAAWLRAGYDSNLRLTTPEDIETSSVEVGADFRIDAAWPTRGITLLTGADRAYFDADIEVPGADYRAELRGYWETPTMSYRLDAGATARNTLATAFDDNGDARVGVQRRDQFGQAAVNWQASPTTSWGGVLSYRDVDYDDSGFRPFRFADARIDRSASLSERLSWTLGLTWSEFEAADDSTRSRTQGATLGLGFLVSPTLEVTATAGLADTETRTRSFFGPFVLESEDTQSAPRASFGLQKQWQYARLTLSAGQSEQPAGNGRLTRVRYGSATLRHELTRRVALRLSGERREFESIGGTETDDDRDAARFAVGLDISLSPSWSLAITAGHRLQRFERLMDVARGNTVSVRVNWKPRGQLL